MKALGVILSAGVYAFLRVLGGGEFEETLLSAVLLAIFVFVIIRENKTHTLRALNLGIASNFKFWLSFVMSIAISAMGLWSGRGGLLALLDFAFAFFFFVGFLSLTAKLMKL